MTRKGACSKQPYISDTAQQRNILNLDFIGATVLPPAIADRGWLVDTAKDTARAMQLALSHRFSVGVAAFDSHCDSQLSSLLDVIEAANAMEWIALVSHDWRDNNKIGQLIRSSFYDFHTLPVDVDRLEITLGRAFGMAALRRTEFHAEDHQEEEMVGASPAAQAALRAIWKVALVDAPVLITGETGTGKELAARTIHARSSRAHAPFVAVNCAALPKELIQTELFGYERGAFTGAYQRSIGKIEAAAGGTLFLDEIGDLPIELQVNLLRFLQDKVIERVGSYKLTPVDVRIIAATHVDLDAAVASGRFREDLLYRLNVLRITIPPLRERIGDVESLARFFFEKFARTRHGVKGISAAAMQCLNAHHWPGNVRELINRIESAVLMCEGQLIAPEDLRLERRSENRRILSLNQFRAQAEKEAITHALQRAGNNVSKAAAELKVSRITLYRLMNKLGIGAS